MDNLYLLLFSEEQEKIELGELIAESNDLKVFKSVNCGDGYGDGNGDGYGYGDGDG